jgi:HTH-type transcriptional regulator/antitoxin HigA
VTDKRPAEVFAPGEFIREELEARGWTQADLAKIMGRPTQTINAIIIGMKSVTAQTATELGKALGTSAQLWLNLQSSYDLSRQGDASDEIAQRAKLYEIAPLKAMEARGWIHKTHTFADLKAEVSRFYQTENLEAVPLLKIAARSNAESTTESHAAQVCWGYRAQQLARCLKAAVFSKDKITAKLGDLRKLAAYPEEIRYVPRVLADMGIRFVIVQHLPKSKIDGASLMVGQSPVIAMSLRYDRIDNFWHTLMHELSHVLHDEPIIDVDIDGKDNDASESRADSDAANMLIPSETLDSFIVRVGPLYSKERINQFANRIHIHPGIIVGQLQHRGKLKFWNKRDMVDVHIRHIVTQEALTDGWGRSISLGQGESPNGNENQN